MLIDLDDLDTDLAEFLSLTGKLLTPEEAVRKAILRSIDPLKKPGCRFEFEARPNDEFYLSIETPPCNADVDLVVAWNVSQQDAIASSKILDRNNSTTSEIIGALRNTIGWLQFWSCRFPDQLWRERFQLLLSERRTGLEALKLKARYQIRPDIERELEAI
jgi:hypothetical protein